MVTSKINNSFRPDGLPKSASLFDFTPPSSGFPAIWLWKTKSRFYYFDSFDEKLTIVRKDFFENYKKKCDEWLSFNPSENTASYNQEAGS